MAVSPAPVPEWWDREIDHEGRTLRPDVRAAVQQIWEKACAKARKQSVDIYDATTIMENTVAQISNWINNNPAPPGGHRIPGLLMHNFHLALLKHKEREIIELVDHPDGMDCYPSSFEWQEKLHCELDYASLCSRLTAREEAIVNMREISNYEWTAIGEAFGISPSRAHRIYAAAIQKLKPAYEDSRRRGSGKNAGGAEETDK